MNNVLLSGQEQESIFQTSGAVQTDSHSPEVILRLSPAGHFVLHCPFQKSLSDGQSQLPSEESPDKSPQRDVEQSSTAGSSSTHSPVKISLIPPAEHGGGTHASMTPTSIPEFERTEQSAPTTQPPFPPQYPAHGVRFLEKWEHEE